MVLVLPQCSAAKACRFRNMRRAGIGADCQCVPLQVVTFFPFHQSRLPAGSAFHAGEIVA